MASIPVQIKRSSVAGKEPLSTDLLVGELAVNFPDKKLYTKDANGDVILVGGGVSDSDFKAKFDSEIGVYDSDTRAAIDSDIASIKLTDLADVSDSKFKNKQVPTWDSESKKFIPADVGLQLAEFGQQHLANNISIPVSNVTPQTVDVFTFTLPSAGTYEVSTFVRSAVSSAATVFSTFLSDTNNVLIANTRTLGVFTIGSTNIQSTIAKTVQLTVTGPTTYKLRANTSGDAFTSNVIGYEDAFGGTTLNWKKISGFVPLNNTVYTFATLPSAAAAGVGGRSFVTDSSVTVFNTAVAGGGANRVPVFSDGVTWRVG